MTNNITRRLRQHNGELVGGAKATSRMRPVHLYCLIEGFPDQIKALQFEWRVKHPTGKRKRPRKYCCPKGRVFGLIEVLKMNKWNDLELTVKIVEEFRDLLVDLPDNITVENLELGDGS